jgi:hypothetical protein
MRRRRIGSIGRPGQQANDEGSGENAGDRHHNVGV